MVRISVAYSRPGVEAGEANNASKKTLDPDDDDTEDDDNDSSAGASPENDAHRDGGSPHVQQVKQSKNASTRKNAWDHDDTYSGDQGDDNDHLLFGSPKADVRLSTLHPEQVQVFRLWQIYLENVDPLLKVTHTPTLQSRIINAVSDLEGISLTMEALLFSVYCVSILSLTNQECRSFFGSPRNDLLATYQFACQQSLLNCKALRSGNVESLTALFLYLVSLCSFTSRHDQLLISSLTCQLSGLGEITDRPSVPVVYACHGHPRRTANGLARGVCIYRIECSRG